MKVVFLKAVPPHFPGDIAEVATGHAQNFLFPRKLATLATPEALALANQRAAQRVADATHAEQQATTALQQLTGKVITLQARAASSGKLYAAITPHAITQAMQAQTGLQLPKSQQAQLPSIKHIGEHTVTLQHAGQTATFTVKV